MFSWEGMTEKVFAVNAGPSIFFANSDGILVHFNGVFVEKIEGVRLNSGAEMDISITKTKMDASEVFSYRGRLRLWVICFAILPRKVLTT